MESEPISTAELRRVVLATISSTHSSSWTSIRESVIGRVTGESLGSLGRHPKQAVNQAIIGLILEGLITLGGRDGLYEPNWPDILLTQQGKQVLSAEGSHLYDPDDYVAFSIAEAPGVSERTTEYLLEAIKCYRHGLAFATAVMLGSAAEVEVLRLAESIARWETDAERKGRLEGDLERARMPSLFGHIRDTVERAARTGVMPYQTHQGSVEHLLSFQEMVRVLRNSAVHAGSLEPGRQKILLCLNTFPTALATLDRLRAWFSDEANAKEG